MGDGSGPMARTKGIVYRDAVMPGDPEHVRRILAGTQFFNDEEISVAVELCQTHLDEGEASGYLFVFAELDGEVCGYACYGHIPGTRASYDLYWIAVPPSTQRRGVGSALLAETEQRIAARAGDRVYVETSSRPQYKPTRGFYERQGYARGAFLDDFYGPGDGKIIYVKVLPA